MKYLVCIALASVPLSAVAQELSPAAASTKVGETVSVQFAVQAQGRNGEFAELHSKDKWSTPGNFFVRLSSAAQKQLTDSGVKDLKSHFAQETIVATGKVEQLNFSGGPFPVIVVSDVKNIRIVEATGYTPTDEYVTKKLMGFEVRFNPVFSANRKSEFKELHREISSQLRHIVKSMPRDKVAFLRKIPIWVEWESKPNSGCVYHPGRKAVRNLGMNPAKARCVEVCMAKNFVRYSQTSQPCMLMHVMANAYLFQVLTVENATVKAAYKQAMDNGKYSSVAHVSDGYKKAYATRSPAHYFAELTESYYGRNDYFPFTKRELKQHDAEGYAMIRKMWTTKLPEKKEQPKKPSSKKK